MVCAPGAPRSCGNSIGAITIAKFQAQQAKMAVAKTHSPMGILRATSARGRPGGPGRLAYAASVVVTVRVWSSKLAMRSSRPPRAWT